MKKENGFNLIKRVGDNYEQCTYYEYKGIIVVEEESWYDDHTAQRITLYKSMEDAQNYKEIAHKCYCYSEERVLEFVNSVL